jgi:hypothetical protein
MTLFCNAVVSAGATAVACSLFTKLGYSRVLMGIAALTIVAAMLFRFFVPAGKLKVLASDS